MNRFSSITCHHSITIGDNVLIGENVHIYDHNHRYDKASSGIPISQQGFTLKEVKIGNNVWLGSGVVVLAGAQIGNNCIIGANCLVYGIIPNNTIVKLKQETEHISLS